MSVKSLLHYQKHNFLTVFSHHHLDLSMPRKKKTNLSLNIYNKSEGIREQEWVNIKLVLIQKYSIIKLTQTENSFGALGIRPSPVGESNFGICSKLKAVGESVLDS